MSYACHKSRNFPAGTFHSNRLTVFLTADAIIPKYPIVDRCHTIGKCYTQFLAAVTESLDRYFGYSFRYHDLFQSGTSIKCWTANRIDRKRYLNLRQTGTRTQCPIRYGCKAFRQINLRKADTPRKKPLPSKRGHPVWQRYADKASIIRKSASFIDGIRI